MMWMHAAFRWKSLRTRARTYGLGAPFPAPRPPGAWKSVTTPGDTSFAGVDNYVDVATNADWWVAVALTLVLVAAVVVVRRGAVTTRADESTSSEVRTR